MRFFCQGPHEISQCLVGVVCAVCENRTAFFMRLKFTGLEEKVSMKIV